MTDSEMAASLKAKGWTVREPWTKENCTHEGRAVMGHTSRGGSVLKWHCAKCGGSATVITPADPKCVQQMAQGFY